MSESQRRAALLVVLVLVGAGPWLPGVPVTWVVDANLAAHFALVAFSLVLLTGWVGQISLGHGAFVGFAVFTTGLVVRHLGIPFPLDVPIVVALTAALAALVGVVALRVRGLYLAVATLIFAWVADSYLFTARWFVGTAGASTIPNRPIGRRGALPRFDFAHPKVFYLVMVAAVAAVWFVAANLRDSKTGRAFFAVRGSESAAAAMGIDVTRTKLIAFALSGAIAGLAGVLLMTGARTATPVNFAFPVSLFYLAIAVVGGIASLPGAVGGAVLFAALTEVTFRIRSLNGWLDIVTTGLLLGVLVVYPGGFAAAARALLPAVRPRRREPAEMVGGHDAPAPSMWEPRSATGVLVDARDVVVRFGGVTALDRVDLTVRAGEIVGLIGPNGAGKTTLFNAVAGFAPVASGSIALFGHPATAMPVHARARLGLGRTFQVVQLLADLTVTDNLLVATHTHDRTGPWSHAAQTDAALQAEAAARARVRDVLRLLDLDGWAHRRAGDLPFGVVREVEVARALVTGAPLLMLDEPASGLDNQETDRLVALLRRLRDETGLTVLVIEHDVRMVRALCDRIVVLHCGKVLAEGDPAAVSQDPAVVAAYLGAVEQGVGV